MEVFFNLSYAVFPRNSDIYENKGTLELCPKLWTLKMLPRHLNRRNMLSTYLNKGGCSDRVILDRRRSTKLTIPATVDGCFFTLIVHLCLRHDAVARVHLRQLIGPLVDAGITLNASTTCNNRIQI